MNRDDFNFNAQDKRGLTAFHYACLRGHIDIVKLLMSKDDLNFNTQNKDGRTAFHLACTGGYIEIMKLLMSRDIDIDINKQDRLGQTAFHRACEGGHIEIVKLLINRDDLDIYTQDYEVRNEEMRWSISPNNFLFRAILHSISLAN